MNQLFICLLVTAAFQTSILAQKNDTLILSSGEMYVGKIERVKRHKIIFNEMISDKSFEKRVVPISLLKNSSDYAKRPKETSKKEDEKHQKYQELFHFTDTLISSKGDTCIGRINRFGYSTVHLQQTNKNNVFQNKHFLYHQIEGSSLNGLDSKGRSYTEILERRRINHKPIIGYGAMVTQSSWGLNSDMSTFYLQFSKGIKNRPIVLDLKIFPFPIGHYKFDSYDILGGFTFIEHNQTPQTIIEDFAERHLIAKEDLYLMRGAHIGAKIYIPKLISRVQPFLSPHIGLRQLTYLKNRITIYKTYQDSTSNYYDYDRESFTKQSMVFIYGMGMGIDIQVNKRFSIEIQNTLTASLFPLLVYTSAKYIDHDGNKTYREYHTNKRNTPMYNLNLTLRYSFYRIKNLKSRK